MVLMAIAVRSKLKFDHYCSNRINEIQYENDLRETLPCIIDGNFHKVTDEDLTHVVSVFKPFMQYAAIKTGAS